MIITVDEALAGKRLDVVLSESQPSLSRSQAKNLIDEGCVKVDGALASKAGLVLREGQMVELAIPEPKKLDLTPQKIDIKILYEDEALAVLEKPHGISVHPSHTENAPTVVHGLLHDLKSLSTIGGVERPGIVHRIDKGTSGILVVSKTDAAHAGLSAQFKAHTIDRRYQALVYGDVRAKLRKNEGRIETLIGRHPTHRKKMTGTVKTGRTAITNWKILEELGALTLVECRLETGRTHQIRVHLTELGFPLVGDQLYGDHERRARALGKRDSGLGKACLAIDHQLLHACFLEFSHPITNKIISFKSELPNDFSNVLELARTHASK